MNKGQTNVEHNLRVVDNIINELTHEFFRYKKKFTYNVTSEARNEHLGMLAGKIGYLANISMGGTKTWNYEERIKDLEDERDNPIPSRERKKYMLNPDVMNIAIRDHTGKVVN